jgi:hypothetical protein
LVKPISSSDFEKIIWNFTKIKSGYYQIPVAEKDRHKTAFSFPGGGLWQFKRMPMGLSNSAPVFERFKI